MLGEIVGLQQISITLAFLGFMVAILLFLRRNGGAIRSSIHSGKRIHVIEETSVAPGERLRLITIDEQTFVMVSAKGTSPSIVPIQQSPPAFDGGELSSAFAAALASTQAPDDASDGHPVELTDNIVSQNPAELAIASTKHHQPSEQEKAQGNDPQMSDFAVTFQRWRQQR